MIKKYITFWIGLAIIVLSMIGAYIYIGSDDTYTVFTASETSDEPIQVEKSTDTYRQEIILPEDADNIDALMILLGNYGETKQGSLLVTLFEDNATIYQWKYDVIKLSNNSYQLFKLPTPYYIDCNRKYAFEIKEIYEDDNGIAIFLNTSNNEDILKINGDIVESRKICYRIGCSKEDIRQRIILVIVVLIVILVIVLLMVSIEDILRNHGFRKISVFVINCCAVTILILFAVVYNHGDGTAITAWGYYFLKSVDLGKTRVYMDYIKDYCRAPDYSIVTNIITAILLSPLYYISKWGGFTLELFDYEIYRKILLVIVVVISSRFLKKIGSSFGFKEGVTEVIAVFYLTSPVVLWGNIAMGQVDCIVVMFAILSTYCFVNKKYELSFFLISISASMKQFELLFMVLPIICLIISELNIKRILRCLGLYLILPVFSWFLSNVYIYDYASISSANEYYNWNHVSRLFETMIAGTSCFVLVLFLVCFSNIYKSIRRKVKGFDYIIAPMIVTISFMLFVGQNPQWVIYTFVIIVLVSLYSDRREDMTLILICMNIGMYVYLSSKFRGAVDNTMVLWGVIGDTFKLNNNSFPFFEFAKHYFRNYYDCFGSLGKTMISASSIASLYVLLRTHKEKLKILNNEYGCRMFVYGSVIMTFIINAVVLVASICIYFGMIVC